MWAASGAAGTFWALPDSSKLSPYIVSSAVTLQGYECLPASHVGVRQVSSYEPLYWAHSTALVIAPGPTDQTSPYLGPSSRLLGVTCPPAKVGDTKSWVSTGGL